MENLADLNEIPIALALSSRHVLVFFNSLLIKLDIPQTCSVRELKEKIKEAAIGKIEFVEKIPSQYLKLSHANRILYGDDHILSESLTNQGDILSLSVTFSEDAYYELKRKIYACESSYDIEEELMKLLKEIEDFGQALNTVKDNDRVAVPVMKISRYCNPSPEISITTNKKSILTKGDILQDFKPDETILPIDDIFNHKIDYTACHSYEELLGIARSMKSPLESFVMLLEPQKPRILKILHQFTENYIIIHRNLHRLREKICPVPWDETRLKAVQKIEEEIRYQCYLLQSHGIPVEVTEPIVTNSFESVIIPQRKLEWRKALREFLLDGSTRPLSMTLLYRSSRDGKRAEDFHRMCDGKQSTLVVIKDTNGNVFGGYTSQKWNSCNSNWYEDTKAFLFTLKNPANLPPTKFPVSNSTHAIYCSANHMPSFGGGFDLQVVDNFARSSYFGFPHSYQDVSGLELEAFAGHRNFIPSVMEVFQCRFYEC